MKDTLFADGESADENAQPVGHCGGEDTVTGFRFDAEVVRVFPDMLDRSIPGYASIVRQSGLLAARFARPGTAVLDLGCSLGASALAMRAALVGSKALDIEIHAVDNSTAMIARAREIVAEDERALPSSAGAPRIVLHEADLVDFPLPSCSVVALNFTLQFVAPAARAALLERIGAALVPGGALILSEKVRFTDPELDALHIDMHHAFKRANGYSATEVARKRAALENVLVPDTLDEHRLRLRDAGFTRSSVWFQCFNFASLVAIRG